MAPASRPGAGKRASRSQPARSALPDAVRKSIGCVDMLAPLLDVTPEANAVWTEFARVLGQVELSRLQASELLDQLHGCLFDFEEWYRPKGDKRLAKQKAMRKVRANKIANAALELRELAPEDWLNSDPDWASTGQRVVFEHYRRCLEGWGVPTGIFGRASVSPWELAWMLTAALPATIEAIEDGAREWGKRTPLTPHAADDTAPRTYLVRRMASFFERNHGSKCPALVAMLAKLIFPGLNSVAFDANAVSKLVGPPRRKQPKKPARLR